MCSGMCCVSWPFHLPVEPFRAPTALPLLPRMVPMMSERVAYTVCCGACNTLYCHTTAPPSPLAMLLAEAATSFSSSTGTMFFQGQQMRVRQMAGCAGSGDGGDHRWVCLLPVCHLSYPSPRRASPVHIHCKLSIHFTLAISS